MPTDEERAQDWSDCFAMTPATRYCPSESSGTGMSKTLYTSTYLQAFVDGQDSASQSVWFRVVKGITQAPDHDRGYGGTA